MLEWAMAYPVLASVLFVFSMATVYACVDCICCTIAAFSPWEEDFVEDEENGSEDR